MPFGNKFCPTMINMNSKSAQNISVCKIAVDGSGIGVDTDDDNHLGRLSWVQSPPDR